MGGGARYSYFCVSASPPILSPAFLPGHGQFLCVATHQLPGLPHGIPLPVAAAGHGDNQAVAGAVAIGACSSLLSGGSSLGHVAVSSPDPLQTAQLLGYSSLSHCLECSFSVTHSLVLSWVTASLFARCEDPGEKQQPISCQNTDC